MHSILPNGDPVKSVRDPFWVPTLRLGNTDPQVHNNLYILTKRNLRNTERCFIFLLSCLLNVLLFLKVVLFKTFYLG